MVFAHAPRTYSTFVYATSLRDQGQLESVEFEVFDCPEPEKFAYMCVSTRLYV